MFHTPLPIPATPSREVVHEAYAFACMRCGRGWEQSYEIEHHVDPQGRPFVVYLADGERVPSPLTRPGCAVCGSQVVRIMRSGRVAAAARTEQPPAGPLVPAQDTTAVRMSPGAKEPAGERHWHLSDLLHPFRHNGRA
ncbi:hypothetical protein E4099_15465 [Streptomyces palmae]|uniref:C2H2-type domain-containing protein n=1 Tax=Streptomyces palmae TaxID=1701085 RepID=A0A4Z0HCE2_9ACTN|nr:hypothetical protein E4099_15465 [Streptomyces palmae]